MNKISEKHLKILQNEAFLSNLPTKVASIILYKNEIISKGHNIRKSHTFQKKFAKNEEAIYFHAETHAIYAAMQKGFKQFNKATIIVARFKYASTKKDKIILANARPCGGCFSCILKFGIKNIIYSIGEGEWGFYQKN